MTKYRILHSNNLIDNYLIFFFTSYNNKKLIYNTDLDYDKTRFVEFL